MQLREVLGPVEDSCVESRVSKRDSCCQAAGTRSDDDRLHSTSAQVSLPAHHEIERACPTIAWKCARHDSNMRPQPPQGCALSPELRARGRLSVAALGSNRRAAPR